MAGPTIASAEVDVDFDGSGMPAQARRIANQAGKVLGPKMARVGDRVGREFITGMDGQLRQVPANAMRAIRQIDTRDIGRDKGMDLAGALGEGITDRADDITDALAKPLAGEDFHRRGRLAGVRFGQGLRAGLENIRSRIAAVAGTLLSAIGGGSGGRDGGSRLADAFGGAFFGGVNNWMGRTGRRLVRLISLLGPQMAALGSALSGTLVGALGSAIVGLGGALLALGGPLIASILAFTMLKKEFKLLLKRSEEIKASVKGLSEAWKEQKAAMADAAATGIAPLMDALSEVLEKSDFGQALGESVASIAGAFTEVVNSPGFSAFMTAMETTFPAAMTLFGTALASLTEGLLTMWATAGPAAEALGESFAGWAASFSDAMTAMADSGQLAAFFDTAVASIDALFGVLTPLSVALGNVFLIGAGPGNEFLSILGGLSEQFLAFTRSAEGATAITAWFEQANTIAMPLLGLIGSLGKTLAGMITPNVVNQLVEFINALSKGLPIIGDLLSVVGEDLGVLDLFTQALRTVGTVVEPILPAMSEFATILGQGLLDALTAFTPVLAVVADVFGRLLGPLGRVVGGLTEFSSASDFAENAARLLPGAITDIGIVLAGLIETIADALPGIATALTGVFTGLGEGLSGAFQKLGPAVGNLLGVLVGELATLLPVVITAATDAFGGLVTGLQAAIPAFVDALPAVVTGVLTLVPLLLEAALALVVAIVQGLADNALMITRGLLGVLTEAVGAITTALPLFVEAAVGLVGGLAAGLLANLPALLEAVGGLIEAILVAIGNHLPAILLAAVEIVGALATGLRESGPAIVAGLLALLPAFTAAVQEMMPTLIEAGTTILDGLMRGLIENEAIIASSMIRMAPAIIKAVTSLLPLWIALGLGIVRGIAKGIADNPQIAGDAIKTIVMALISSFMQLLGISSPSTVFIGLGQDVMNGLRDGVQAAGEAVIAYFRNLPGDILAQLQGLAGDLHAWASDAMQRARDAIAAGVGNLIGEVQGLPGAIISAIGDLSSTLSGVGADLVAGLVSGFSGGIAGLLDSVGSVAQQVIDRAKSVFKERSPSKVFQDIGANAVAGLVQGLENNTRSAADAAAALARGSIGGLEMNGSPISTTNYNNARNNNVAAGAIQIVTQTTDPEVAANMVLDRLVARMA
jgi:hypothetical protein